MKFVLPDYTAAKDASVATRYRREQEVTRAVGILSTKKRDRAVEVFAGTGGLTKIYQQDFKHVMTNDINKNVDTTYHLQAADFIDDIDWIHPAKIDLIDFDCYGCPAFLIQKFFEIRGSKDCPLVLCFSDGLGLWMKRNKAKEPIEKRYLVPLMSTEKIWNKHPILIHCFMTALSQKYDMKVTKLFDVQTKFKNYTLGSYLFETDK
jgi:hypothetical protein